MRRKKMDFHYIGTNWRDLLLCKLFIILYITLEQLNTWITDLMVLRYKGPWHFLVEHWPGKMTYITKKNLLSARWGNKGNRQWESGSDMEVVMKLFSWPTLQPYPRSSFSLKFLALVSACLELHLQYLPG